MEVADDPIRSRVELRSSRPYKPEQSVRAHEGKKILFEAV